MIVTCPNCTARYKLDQAKVQGRGAKVTCARCGRPFVAHREDGDVPDPGGDANREPDALDFARVGVTWTVRKGPGHAGRTFSDLVELRALLAAGQADDGDEISHDGNVWRRIQSFPDLAVLFRGVYDRSRRAEIELLTDPQDEQSISEEDEQDLSEDRTAMEVGQNRRQLAGSFAGRAASDLDDDRLADLVELQPGPAPRGIAIPMPKGPTPRDRAPTPKQPPPRAEYRPQPLRAEPARRPSPLPVPVPAPPPTPSPAPPPESVAQRPPPPKADVPIAQRAPPPRPDAPVARTPTIVPAGERAKVHTPPPPPQVARTLRGPGDVPSTGPVADILRRLNELPGVVSTVAFDQRGRAIAALPADQGSPQEVVQRMLAHLDLGLSIHGNAAAKRSVVVNFASAILFGRRAEFGGILVHATPAVATNTLGVGLNAGMLKLKDILAPKPPGAVTGVTAQPEPALERPALPERSSAEVAPALTKELIDALAKRIGPMAAMVFRRGVTEVAGQGQPLRRDDLGALVQRLALTIDNPTQNASFLDEARRIVARR